MTMSLEFRMKYLEKTFQRYERASKASKTLILDELCKVCGYVRKYAIWKLGQLARGRPVRPKRKRPRPKRYGEKVLLIVEAVWESANYPWSVRLKEILRLWLPSIKKRFFLTPEMEKQFLEMSPSTMDRALKSKKHQLKKRLYGRTKPGTLLKHQIPIKTEHWDVKKPGHVEVDCVSHSGPNASGEFLYSVNLTDIASTWVETRAVMGRGERGVFAALVDMRKALPFNLLSLDSDNGGEFINYHLVRYCQREKIQFTRSRPYKKDDNAHIEQKNWTHVRKLMGWSRYDSSEAEEAMSQLYRNDLRLFMNLFQPSVKLVKTIRKGSRLKRIYDTPQTPLDRLLALAKKEKSKIKNLKLAQLAALRKSLDPFELSEQVNQHLKRIWQSAHRPVHQSKAVPTAREKKHSLSEPEEKALKQLSKIFGLPRQIKKKPVPMRRVS